MCRLLVARLSGDGVESISDVLAAFVESNRFDPYLERVSGGRYYSHDDGWGLAAVGYGENPSVIYHRMIEPIYYESSLRMLDLIAKRLQRYSEVYLLLHARKSSRNEPYGGEYVHPFMRLLENGAIWFAHNGGAMKNELARELGVYPWVRVDSELLGYFIMGAIDECLSSGGGLDNCVGDAYVKGLNYIPSGSGYNTGLLALVGREASLYLSHRVVGNPSQELMDYYSMVSYASREVLIAGSITIRNYLPKKITRHLNESIIEPGVYKVTAGNLVKLAQL